MERLVDNIYEAALLPQREFLEAGVSLGDVAVEHQSRAGDALAEISELGGQHSQTG